MKGTKALIVLAALAVAGGCGSPSSTAKPRTPPPATASTTAPAAEAREVTTATKPASATPTGWATGPITVTHEPSVPPVPLLTGIRYASHKDGYDRVVLDIPGALPGYSARYVSEVRRDGSGQVVSVPGEAFLLIVLHPARAHRDSGTPTVTGTHRINLPGIKAYAVVGDYEGYVSIALGLNGVRKFHVAELTDRIYIDVAV